VTFTWHAVVAAILNHIYLFVLIKRNPRFLLKCYKLKFELQRILRLAIVSVEGSKLKKITATGNLGLKRTGKGTYDEIY